MLGGISIDQSVALVGKKTSTTSPCLVKALIKLGFKVCKFVRLLGRNKIFLSGKYYSHLPKACIAKVRSKGKKVSHWILIYSGKTYDPDPPHRYGHDDNLEGYEYISAYIPIEIEA